jgi:hypothetical protein
MSLTEAEREVREALSVFTSTTIPLFSNENAELIVNRINHFGKVKSLYLYQLKLGSFHQLFSIYNARQLLTVRVYDPYQVLISFDKGYASIADGEIEKFYDNLKAEFFPDLSVLEITLKQVLEKHEGR